MQQSITICSYCRKIQTGPDTWEFQKIAGTGEGNSTLTHGVCPACCDRVMDDYHNGKKDAGAADQFLV